MSSKIPRVVHIPGESKKVAQKLEVKETAPVCPSTNGPKSDRVLRAQKENILKKNVVTKIHKGAPSHRYGPQAELRDQKQHLMAANEDLQKHLTDSQQRIAELELQYAGLEKENAEMHKQLKYFCALLVAAKIDPVSGETVGKAAQQNEDERKEVVRVSTDLRKELRAVSDAASQQRGQLEEIQRTMAELTKSHDYMKQERETFSLEAAEMEEALKEAEALLL
ncbi:small kinetochore-associated protein [Thalassophryne amazonica]|uniref:small kinetochore-associated protein n=1 Tax=Thalassophryne amazonica TaxID=390379 RepID=UPI001470DB1A|nr:small kinetochore-associated protein [Thalassophryne amazonica]